MTPAHAALLVLTVALVAWAVVAAVLVARGGGEDTFN